MMNLCALCMLILQLILLGYIYPAEARTVPDIQTNDSETIKLSGATIFFTAGINSKSIAILLQVIDTLRHRGVKTIAISINSTGGDPNVGLGAYYYLKKLPVTIVTYNMFQTSSSAIFLYCAGQKRYSSPYGYFIFHGVKTNLKNSTINGLKQYTAQNELFIKAERDIYSVCMNKAVLEKHDLFGDDLLIDASTAKSFGLVNQTEMSIFDFGEVYYIHD